MMYPISNNNNKKSTSSATASRSVIPLLLMNSSKAQQQQRQSRTTTIFSTEKIFGFILLISVFCFQLALHYSSSINIHDNDKKDKIETSSMTMTTAFFNHRLANVCPNIKSTNYAPASIKPKIPIINNIDHNDKDNNKNNTTSSGGGDQRYIASGGYEGIAKGSGPIHLAGPIINLISNIQHTEFNIFGSIAELGVHHGRFTSFLFITARTTEKLIVVDLFEQSQDLNIDMSGLGDYKQFVKGMNMYGLQVSDLYKMYKGISTDQIPFDWSNQDAFEPFRLISIDAGHTAALTFNDLQLAFCNLLKGGVVIIDDWFHPRWPGVVEGFYEFTHYYSQNSNNNHNIVQIEVYPFLLCESKLYVTNDKDFHKLYMQRIIQDPSSLHEWVSPFAHESSRINNKKWWYEMNGGIPYLRCDSSRLPSNPNVTQQIWLDRLY